MIETNFISESIERAIINGILSKEDHLLNIIEKSNIPLFAIPSHKRIFDSILESFESGQVIVPEIIYSKISTEDAEVLSSIMSSNVNLKNYDSYFDVLKEKAITRHCRYIADSINESITKEKGSKLLDEIQDKINIASDTLPSSISLFGDNIFNIIPNPETYTKDSIRNVLGISSGIKKLDDITLGFNKGSFNVIGGRPSSGKTLLARNILLNTALTNTPVALFSIDEPESIIKMKTVSTLTGIDYNHLKKQELNTEELNRLKRNIDIIKKMPFIIDYSSNFTIKTIRAKIKKILYKYKDLGMIAIDYIQQMGVTTEEITKVSQGIKSLCAEFNIPILAISQLSRNIENRTIENDEKWTEFPLMSDLRQSGSLEQDADRIIILKGEPRKAEDGQFKEKRRTRIFVIKQRDGEAGIYFDMNLVGRIQTLEEINGNELW